MCTVHGRNNDGLRVSCLTLINALISSPDDLDFRIHLRNEFMRVGLIDVLDTLEDEKQEELQLQLKVFNDHKEEDFDEFAQRFDNIRLELDDVNECFELIKNLDLTVLLSPTSSLSSNTLSVSGTMLKSGKPLSADRIM